MNLRPLPVLPVLLCLAALPAQAKPTAPVTLRVVTPDGSPTACTVNLARYQSDEQPLSPVPSSSGFQPRQLAASDFRNGIATLPDLPRGNFVFVLTAAKHAQAISRPFLVGEKPVEVVVELRVGATAVGRVVDEDGHAVAGAMVTTDDASERAVASAIPGHQRVPRVTRTSTITDAQGRFDLPHLAAGAYTIRAGHDDWCPLQLDTLRIDDEARADLGNLQLRRGTRVTGQLVGAGHSQYELELRTAVTTTRQGATAAALRGTTWTLRDGSFRFVHRVPPGRYRLLGKQSQPISPFGGSGFGSFDVSVEVLAGQPEVVLPIRAPRQ